MNESTALASATNRLEDSDSALTSIDLRGKGRIGSSGSGTDTSIPRSNILRFLTALKQCPPPYLGLSGSCQLRYLALHNHFLDPCELPLLFDVLPGLTALDTLVIFHHDVGDAGVDLLMQALMGNPCNNKSNTSAEKSLTSCRGKSSGVESRGVNVDKTKHITIPSSCGLRELYLSHCNISFRGASAISKALDYSSAYSGSNNNKLTHLQVLSLGSNLIEEEGAKSLAVAFGRYPSLRRLVLHGNKGIMPLCLASSNHHVNLREELKTPMFHHALSTFPTHSNSAHSTPTGTAMAIFAPLILPHIQRRWDKDRVLVRPYDILRKRLREEMYKKDSTFVDSRLEVMPDVLSWMGREGSCCRQTSLHSQTYNLRGREICHSSGYEQCRACAAIHLDDLYYLFVRMPHLIDMFQVISVSQSKSSNLGTYL